MPSVSKIVVNGPTAIALIVKIGDAKLASYLVLASILVAKALPISSVVVPTPAGTECVSPTPLRTISTVPPTNAAPAPNVTCVS